MSRLDNTTMHELVGEILRRIGEDPLRGGLVETPARVSKYLRELTAGYDRDPAEVLKTFEDGAEGIDEMIFQGAIPFFSLCEHHMAPFSGWFMSGISRMGKSLGSPNSPA